MQRHSLVSNASRTVDSATSQRSVSVVFQDSKSTVPVSPAKHAQITMETVLSAQQVNASNAEMGTGSTHQPATFVKHVRRQW